MCGIAGVVGTDKAETWVSGMLKTMPHRGPDDAGLFCNNVAGIGMNRLSIIDLKTGMQPFFNRDRTIWSVCNGEIYNFQSLRKSLKELGYKFSSQSDSEVIVHAYDHFGLEFIDKIDGMFGLALWDQNRRRLIIARDRLGIKPLYFFQRERFFAFGSEIKTLLSLPQVSPDLDKEALHQYLNFGYCMPPLTLFKGIQKLAPGEMLVFENERACKHTYWKLDSKTDKSIPEWRWIELAQEAFNTAVDSQLVSDVPLGSFLSGGIDSSAIVARIATTEPNSLNTYSIGYAGDATARYYNELDYADLIANKFATKHNRIVVQPDIAKILPRLVWHLEEPICDSAAITTHLVSELASKTVRVIMSGVGGDELFAGYTRYKGERVTQLYRQIPRFLRNGISSILHTIPIGRGTRLLDFARYARRIAESSEMEWRQRYASYGRIGDSTLLLGQAPSSDPYADLCNEIDSSDSLLNLMQIDLRSQLSECLLQMTDKITMASSLECRVPFLDTKLVELAARIPADTKLRGGRLKHILKETQASQLPDSIINRPKRGFGAPVGTWLTKELASLQEAVLGRNGLERRGILDGHALREMRSQHANQNFDGSDLLMVLMNLELTLRLFWDGESVNDVSEQLSETFSLRDTGTRANGSLG